MIPGLYHHFLWCLLFRACVIACTLAFHKGGLWNEMRKGESMHLSKMRASLRMLPLWVLALPLGSAFAQFGMEIGQADHYNVNQSDFWRDHNFAMVSSTGRNYSTWSDPTQNGLVKYTDLTLRNSSTIDQVCYQVWTRPIIYPSYPAGPNPDTRFWAQSGPSSWAKLSDDIQPGVLQSNAMIWLGQYASITIRVSAFGIASNTMDFTLSAQKMPATTAAACQGVSSVPFASVTNGWPVIVNGN
jgi:hypothetical protein